MEKEIIIGKAVIEGTVVSGKFGSTLYGAEGLMGLSLESLDSIYSSLEVIANKQTSGGLINKTKISKDVESQMNLVKAIFEIKKEKAEEFKTAKLERELKAKKLALLKHAKDVKEIALINDLTIEDLDKQIAELEPA